MHFHITSRLVLKHVNAGVRATSTRLSTTSARHDNDPEKKRNLFDKQHKTSTPHKRAPDWNDDHASQSEAFIRADKSNASVTELQAQTVDYVLAHHPSDDRMGPTTAHYSRDEVHGPLSGAEGKEDLSDDYAQTVSKKTFHKETNKVLKEDPKPKKT